MSAQERSQLTATWLRSIQHIQVPPREPRCCSGQHLKVQQKSLTHPRQIYYVVELKWPNGSYCCGSLDASGVAGGSCADWNASLLPRPLWREQGEKRRSESVYEFNSRHFNLEPRQSSLQKMEDLFHKGSTCQHEQKLFSARAGLEGGANKWRPQIGSFGFPGTILEDDSRLFFPQPLPILGALNHFKLFVFFQGRLIKRAL